MKNRGFPNFAFKKNLELLLRRTWLEPRRLAKDQPAIAGRMGEGFSEQ
jgi:hypothetical protein